MAVKPIRNKTDYNKALSRIDDIIDAKQRSPKYEELEILTALVEAYENINISIDTPEAREAIKYRMEQGKLKRKDIAPLMGGKGRVSELFLKKRPLSLRIIKNCNTKLGIPLKSLFASSD